MAEFEVPKAESRLFIQRDATVTNGDLGGLESESGTKSYHEIRRAHR
jgi:hypothetical protein